jgi:hypothetical protein
MRNRSTARLRPGSWPGRWLALALLAIPLPGPAAADQPAPPEAPGDVPDAPPEAPGDVPDAPPEAATEAAPDAPPEAATEALADAPPAPDVHRLAIIDVPPTPQQAAAAALIVPAARAAIQADGRFVVASPEQVSAARAEHGVGETDLSYPDACRVGRAVGASHVILLGGYALTTFTSEKTGTRQAPAMRGEQDHDPTKGAGENQSELTSARGMVAEQPPGHGAMHSPPASTFEYEARATASVIVMDMASCKVGEQAVIRARRESDVSEQDARDRLRGDFGTAVRQGLQKLFPLRAFVRESRDPGGIVSHGSRHGVRRGQYYDVRRAGHVVGQVHVDEVQPDSAQVSLVRGVRRLQPGDRLTERDAVQVWEVALAATPNLLARREADAALGVATGVHLTVAEPVSGNAYGLTVEYLKLDDLQRWRGGVSYAWQLRIIPRRLFAHARVGVGLFTASQPFIDEDGRMDTGKARGLELLNGLGVKALLGHSLAVQAEASLPLAAYDGQWYRASNDKFRAPDDALLYPRAQRRSLPTLSLALGWRF